MPRLQLGAVAVATISLLCACSESNDSALRTADNGGELARSYGAEEGVGILEHVLFSNASSLSRITEITNERRRDCMVAGGFVDYPVVELPPAESLSPAQPIVRPLYLAEASETGYRSISAADSIAEFEDPEVTYYQSLAPAERTSFEQRTLECTPIVSESVLAGELAGYGENRLQLLAVQADLVTGFLASTQLGEIHREWSECMADQGYQFSSPIDAIEAAQMASGNTPVPSAEEIAQATADARCREQIQLEARVINLFRGAEAVVVAENEVLIREVVRQSDAAMKLTP
jgi:hypothetical protein